MCLTNYLKYLHFFRSKCLCQLEFVRADHQLVQSRISSILLLFTFIGKSISSSSSSCCCWFCIISYTLSLWDSASSRSCLMCQSILTPPILPTPPLLPRAYPRLLTLEEVEQWFAKDQGVNYQVAQLQWNRRAMLLLTGVFLRTVGKMIPFSC